MKTAIVLFNLGGPDKPADIKPFRINLFMDKAIIRAPIFVRVWLSRYIAARSQKAAEQNYALMGGRSPLLELTQAQANALEAACNGGTPAGDTRCFIAMRYWHPFASETVQQVKAYKPDRILLFPLYPQFSTTTTGSSVADWHEQAAKAGLVAATTTLCCYFRDEAYIASIAALVGPAIADAKAKLPPGSKLRLLFSAHGLPETIVKSGDPYQYQVEQTVAAVMARLADQDADQDAEHVVCYQSRATPQKWIDPSTVAEIERAGAEKIAVLLVPIAFVSDHIETLVELDIENRHIAAQAGVPGYFRAPVPNADQKFIAALAGLVQRATAHGDGLCSFAGGRACVSGHRNCPFRQ